MALHKVDVWSHQKSRSICVKQALNTRRWLINALVMWHVSYKITTLFPWSSRINLVPFRTLRGPLFLKPAGLQTSNWSGTIFCRFLQQTGSSSQSSFWQPVLVTIFLYFNFYKVSIIFEKKNVHLRVQFQTIPFCSLIKSEKTKEVCNRGVAWSLLKLDGGWQATPSITKFLREDSISKQRMQPSKFLLSNGFVVNLSITFNKLPWRKQLKMMSLDLVLRMNPSKLFYLCHYNEFVPTYLYHI